MKSRPRLWESSGPVDRGRPPLLLLHGFSGCGVVWEDVLTELSDSFSCIPVDLPGHGQNQCADSPEQFGFDAVCEALAEMLTSLGWPRAHVWGYSMGGRVALHFALRHRDLVAGLILESTSPGIADNAERAARLDADHRLASEIVERGVESFAERWMEQPLFASQKLLPPERRAHGRRLRLANSPSGLASALRGFSVGAQAPLHDRLGELTMPTLILAGELDNKYRAIAESMARSIPRAELCIIPAAGHAVSWEKPMETAAIARRFLAGVGI